MQLLVPAYLHSYAIFQFFKPIVPELKCSVIILKVWESRYIGISIL